MPLLPAGHAPLKVLHLSDIHMAPDQRAKQEWLRGLADLEPDLVVDTGDNLAHMRAVPVVADALGGLLDVPGRLRPRLQRLLRARHAQPAALPAARHRQAQHLDAPAALARAQGPLRRRRLARPDQRLRIPDGRRHDHRLRRRRRPAPGVRRPRRASPARPTRRPTCASAVAHAPYLRVLDQFAADGYDAIIAGHTHGGQVCLPGGRALTTNCDLEPARARGLHRHPADSAPGDPGSSWLHVSAGLGTNPYVRIPGRLPSRGHPDDARPRFLSSRRPDLSTRARLWWCGTTEKGVPACPS